MMRVFIAAGANIDPERNITEGLLRLKEEVALLAVSTFYRTAALGGGEQPPFLNGAVLVETAMSPRTLKFDVLRGIEAGQGRRRSADKYAPRPLDLDIALYGNEVIEEDDLRIPDPDIGSRIFVSVPLLELDKQLILPGTHEPLAALATPRDRAGLAADNAFTQTLRERLCV